MPQSIVLFNPKAALSVQIGAELTALVFRVIPVQAKPPEAPVDAQAAARAVEGSAGVYVIATRSGVDVWLLDLASSEPSSTHVFRADASEALNERLRRRARGGAPACEAARARAARHGAGRRRCRASRSAPRPLGVARRAARCPSCPRALGPPRCCKLLAVRRRPRRELQHWGGPSHSSAGCRCDVAPHSHRRIRTVRARTPRKSGSISSGGQRERRDLAADGRLAHPSACRGLRSAHRWRRAGPRLVSGGRHGCCDSLRTFVRAVARAVSSRGARGALEIVAEVRVELGLVP